MAIDLNLAFANNHRPTDAELDGLVITHTGCEPLVAAHLTQALHDRFLLIERRAALHAYDVEEEKLRRAAEGVLEELLRTVRAGGEAKPVWTRYSAALSALMAHIAQEK